MIDWVLGRYRPIERRALWQILAFSAVMLVVRLLLAQPFWASGQTRWVEFPTQLASSTTYLFANEFMLHFGLFTMPIPFPIFTAWVTGLAEIILPVLIVIGLFTRLGGLALFAMAVVIQLVFPEAFVNFTDPRNSHGLWMAYGLAIAWFGPGMFSLDWLVRRFGLSRVGLARA